MDPYRYRMEEAKLARARDREAVAEFLHGEKLRLDPGLEKYYLVYKDDEIVGGAGNAGRVIKCAAVRADHRGEGILDALLSRLLTDLRRASDENIFVFTKPENRIFFQDLSFYPVAATPRVILLEAKPGEFSRYLENIAGLGLRQKESGTGAGATGAIVMNANPFTNGHRHLATLAAEQCERLIIFVVEEDVSEFPFVVRLRLVREGVADLANVTVVPGGPYIISGATFPDYFLKDASEAALACADLDLTIFADHIAPAVGITRRFVGEEPFSPVTQIYNEAMLRTLPTRGIDVVVTPRLACAGQGISASRVRAALQAGDFATARRLVPESTVRFLGSPEAELIVKGMRE